MKQAAHAGSIKMTAGIKSLQVTNMALTLYILLCVTANKNLVIMWDSAACGTHFFAATPLRLRKNCILIHGYRGPKKAVSR